MKLSNIVETVDLISDFEKSILEEPTSTVTLAIKATNSELNGVKNYLDSRKLEWRWLA